jgi:Flp pilus assembly protein protease CpaA
VFSYPLIVLVSFAFIWIFFAMMQDLRYREVADWLNFSLVLFALGFRFFYSLFENQWWFFIYGLLGFFAFLVLGHLLYYGRIFAGGDAKLFIALGAILPFSDEMLKNILMMSIFVLIFLVAGAIYGLTWSFVLAAKNKEEFGKKFYEKLKRGKKLIMLFLPISIILALFGFFNILFIYIAVSVFLLPYLFIFAKSVDEALMIKKISTERLREGDWLYKGFKVKGRIMKAKWEGLSKKEIEFLRKNYRGKVTIREGVPFVPVFLISFFTYVIYYGILLGAS